MKEVAEKTLDIVAAFSSGNSLVVVIPEKARKEYKKDLNGQRFTVKIDEKQRLIYEPLNEGVR